MGWTVRRQAFGLPLFFWDSAIPVDWNSSRIHTSCQFRIISEPIASLVVFLGITKFALFCWKFVAGRRNKITAVYVPFVMKLWGC